MSEVKFHQLPTGARFRWKQRELIKVSPLLAREPESDRTCVVPRAARVETDVAEAIRTDAPHRAIPLAAVQRLETELGRLIEGLPLEPRARSQALNRMKTLFTRLEVFDLPG